MEALSRGFGKIFAYFCNFPGGVVQTASDPSLPGGFLPDGIAGGGRASCDEKASAAHRAAEDNAWQVLKTAFAFV
jgi:hypothetical protein